MDRFDFVEHFNEDIDSILDGQPQNRNKEDQAKYNDLLSLAAILAETDIIPENGKKQMLRRQLVKRCLAENTAGRNKEAIMRNFFKKRRPALLVGSFALVAMLGFYLISPATLTAMAENIGNILKIGPYVTLINEDSTPEPPKTNPLTPEQQAQLDRNGYVEIQNENGTMVVSTWGEPPVDKVNYSNLVDAQQGVSYKLLAPQYLPEGYSFKSAETYRGSKEYINLEFQGPGKDIILMQRLMNEQTKYETGGKVVPVNINGQTGAWVDSSLTWDKDGINYILIAKGLSQDEILKIAESI